MDDVRPLSVLGLDYSFDCWAGNVGFQIYASGTGSVNTVIL